MGKSVIFLDGNPLNTDKDNLFFVTTEELRLFHKQNKKKWSKDYTRAMLLLIRLQLSREGKQ